MNSLSLRRGKRRSTSSSRRGFQSLRMEQLEGRAVMAADAVNDFASTTENALVSTLQGGQSSVLANDTGNAATVYGYNTTSALGATVTVNPDGTFTYDPSTSSVLQALGNGQSLVDSFSYAIKDSADTFTAGATVQTFTGLSGGNIAALEARMSQVSPSGTATFSTLNFTDPQNANGGPHFGGDIEPPGLTGGDDNNYGVVATGFFEVARGGTYTFGSWTDDASRIRIDLNNNGSFADPGETVMEQTGCCNDSFGAPVAIPAGTYRFEAMYAEGGGGSGGEFFYAPGSQTSFNSSFHLLGDSSGGIAMGTGSLSRDTGLVTVNVSGVNEAPVAANDAGYTVSENGTLTVPSAVNTQGELNVAVYRGLASGTNEGLDARRNSGPSDATGTTTSVNYTDDVNGNTSGAHFGGDLLPPSIANGQDDNNYGVVVSGFIQVNFAGTYTFGSWTDDSTRIRLDLNQNGTFEANETILESNACCADRFSGGINLSAGNYRIEMQYAEGGGGSSGEFFYANGTQTSFGTTGAFRLIGDPSAGISVFRRTDNTLLANDTDEEVRLGNSNQSLSVVGLSSPGALTGQSANGATVTLNPDGSFSYDPSTSQAAQLLTNGQSLTDTFTYTVSDNAAGGAGTSTATATVVVTGVSDPVGDFYTASEDQSLNVPAANGITSNDTPQSPVTTVQGQPMPGQLGTPNDGQVTVTTDQGGTVTVTDTGAIINYTSPSSFNDLGVGQTREDSFTYTSTPVATSAVVATDGSSSGYTVSSTDLLNGNVGSVTSGFVDTRENTSGNVAVLTNGQFGTANSISGSEDLAIPSNTEITYTLDTAASPLGYTLTEIDVYSGWQDSGRDNQTYTVTYSTVDAPDTFIQFTSPINVNFNPALNSGRSTITASGGGVLATNVARVRFNFGAQENGHVGYRELDVFGAPTTVSEEVTVTISVVGTNDNPSVTSSGPITVAEGGTAVLTATGTDPDAGDVVTFQWDFDNNGSPDSPGATGSITWQQLVAAGINNGDASYSTPIRVRAVDNHGGLSDWSPVTINVTNTGPYDAAITPSTSVTIPGVPVEFTLNATDYSPVDQAGEFTWSIDWNDDGVADEIVTGQDGTTVSHTFTTFGTQTVNVVEVRDQDGDVGTATATTEVSVDTVFQDPTTGSVYYGGTNSGDRIVVSAITGGGIQIQASVSGGENFRYRFFDFTEESMIVVTGNGGADSITVSGRVTVPVEFHGGDGNDYLTGSLLNDRLFGDEGADTLSGGLGDDLLEGGNGNDSVTGGDGNDTLYGGAGSDTMNGGAGDDFLFAGNDLDRSVDGGEGSDVVFGEGPNDSLGTVPISDTPSSNTISGGNGNDIVVGGGAVDSVVGSGGNDILIGGMGADNINGGSGDDILIGGSTDYDSAQFESDGFGGFTPDSNLTALISFLDEWTSGNDFETRRENLIGLGLDPESNVQDDGARDSLFGTTGTDWFLSALNDRTDLAAGERIN